MSSRTKKALWLVIVGIAVNLSLALTKYFVGIRTNSLCILLDATNGFLDMLTGIITAGAFGLTAIAKSEKFPYGLGRSEYLAGFIVAVVAAIMGVVFLLDSLNRLAMPEPVWFGLNNCILIAVTALVKLAFAVAVTLMNRKIRSKALSAVMVDAFLDVGITVTTVLSFTLTQKVGYSIDALFGIGISIVVIGVSVKMIIDAVRVLLGVNACEEEKSALIALCKEEPVIDEINVVRLHDYGFRAKYGTVSVTFSERSATKERDAACVRVASSLKKETGATVEIIPFNKPTKE